MSQPAGQDVLFETPGVRRAPGPPNLKRVRGFYRCIVVLLAFAAACFGQAPAEEQPPESRHTHSPGILPTNGTYPSLTEYKPISSGEKFRIARRKSFNAGSVLLAAVLAGRSQWDNDSPSFGQGTKGYTRYLGAAYANVVIGRYLTQAVYPSLLHQDPRFFRRGLGSGWARIGNAVGQVFRARADSGQWQFNYSGMAGSATAVAVSSAYYPENRAAHEAAARFGIRVGFHMAGNVLKEFWPDVSRKLFGGRRKPATSTAP